ncbi:MAG: hypothetical protein HQK76_05625 [Desulfobacterales bacterium]|nr:hypothetical protein [Desulfobacterales bacterium]
MDIEAIKKILDAIERVSDAGLDWSRNYIDKEPSQLRQLKLWREAKFGVHDLRKELIELFNSTIVSQNIALNMPQNNETSLLLNVNLKFKATDGQ